MATDLTEIAKQIKFKGYVSASYNYNFNSPRNNLNTGSLFEQNANQFMLHKFALILEKPVDYSSSDWGLGFFAQTIFGQDAAGTQARGLSLGAQGDLYQAYHEVNAPVGNGLKITLGKFRSSLGYESAEEELSPLWTTGIQNVLITAATHTGLRLSYKIDDAWKIQFFVTNGWDVVVDNNHLPSLLGHLTFQPSNNFSIDLSGYGGPEQTSSDIDPTGVPNADADWRKGIDVIAAFRPIDELGLAIQADYGHETLAVPAGDAQWWALGAWLTYDFSQVFQAAFRGDFVDDVNGARSSGSPATAPYAANAGQKLYSVALALNIKPLDGLRIAPEFRYDGSTLATAYDGRSWRVMALLGAVYFF
jgi:hypothetical protein